MYSKFDAMTSKWIAGKLNLEIIIKKFYIRSWKMHEKGTIQKLLTILTFGMLKLNIFGNPDLNCVKLTI